MVYYITTSIPSHALLCLAYLLQMLEVKLKLLLDIDIINNCWEASIRESVSMCTSGRYAKNEFCIYKDIKRNRPNAYRYEQAVWVSQSQSCQMIRFEWGKTKEWLLDPDCVRDDETQITGSLDINSSKISMTYIIMFCKSQSHWYLK